MAQVDFCTFSFPRTELVPKETMSAGGMEDDIPQAERKTVTDFCYLLDKSKQLFNGLRSAGVECSIGLGQGDWVASKVLPCAKESQILQRMYTLAGACTYSGRERSAL